MSTITTSPPLEIEKSDTYHDVANIDYNSKNPVSKLMRVMEESFSFAEEMNYYLNDSIQFLFPFSHLELYGPSGDAHQVLDPTLQDNKVDFQKQNVRDFILTDTCIARGLVTIGGWTGPFLKISYTGGPDSQLSAQSNHTLGDYIYAWIQVQGNTAGDLIKVPYNEDSDRYEAEIWGYPNHDLQQHLSNRGIASLQSGGLIIRNDLVKGNADDFKRENLDNRNMYDVSPDNTMHPIRPLHVALAWADNTQTYWDSNFGRNYHYEFNMIYRGWDNFMQVGVSGNPHGGIGFLHYRNLVSNYKSYSRLSELGRTVMPWMFDASGQKPHEEKKEEFLSVEYIDLHILKAECAIGIHRHRDNQEIFFLMSGKAVMVTGDWNTFPDRERAFEIRTLTPGSFSLLKAGQLHALINALDTDATLLMLGGYD